MKLPSLTLGLILAAAAPAFAQSSSVGPNHIKEAEAFVRATLGKDCDMNGRTDIPLNTTEPETPSHFFHEIKYNLKDGSTGGGVAKRIELYQMFCGMGAYNLQHAFVTRDDETAEFRLAAFAQPRLSYSYADEERTKLNSPPRIVGYSSTFILTNASYDATTDTVLSHSLWRGIGDAWASGEWTFTYSEFLLNFYEVDPTFDGATGQGNEKTYVIYPQR